MPMGCVYLERQVILETQPHIKHISLLYSCHCSHLAGALIGCNFSLRAQRATAHKFPWSGWSTLLANCQRGIEDRVYRVLMTVVCPDPEIVVIDIHLVFVWQSVG